MTKMSIMAFLGVLWGVTTADPAGAQQKRPMLWRTVDFQNGAEFVDIQSAIDFTRPTIMRQAVYIYPGIYREEVHLHRSRFCLIGADRDSVVLQGVDGHDALTILADEATEVTIANLTIRTRGIVEGEGGRGIVVRYVGRQEDDPNCGDITLENIRIESETGEAVIIDSAITKLTLNGLWIDTQETDVSAIRLDGAVDHLEARDLMIASGGAAMEFRAPVRFGRMWTSSLRSESASALSGASAGDGAIFATEVSGAAESAIEGWRLHGCETVVREEEDEAAGSASERDHPG